MTVAGDDDVFGDLDDVAFGDLGLISVSDFSELGRVVDIDYCQNEITFKLEMDEHEIIE